MNEELDSVRAEAFDYLKSATEESNLITARFQIAVNKFNEMIAIWQQGGSHSTEDDRTFRELLRSISKIQANFLDVRSASTTRESQLIIEGLDRAASQSNAKLDSAGAGLERLVRRVNVDLPILKSIVGEFESRLDELDNIIEDRKSTKWTATNIRGKLESGFDKDADYEQPIQNPLSMLILQIADPAKSKEFEPTPEYREAVRRLINLIQDNRLELDEQRLRLQSADERRHWRLEQWQSIGPHVAEFSSHLTSILQELKTLVDERNRWLNQWNNLVTNAAIEAAEGMITGAVSRITAINHFHEELYELSRDQFPVSSKLVSRIENKSSEFTEYVDENLLKKPPNSKRDLWP